MKSSKRAGYFALGLLVVAAGIFIIYKSTWLKNIVDPWLSPRHGHSEKWVFVTGFLIASVGTIISLSVFSKQKKK